MEGNQTQQELDLGALDEVIEDIDFDKKESPNKEEDLEVEDPTKPEEEEEKDEGSEESDTEEKEEKTPEKDSDIKKESNQETLEDYTNFAKDLLESGEWEDVIVEDENGEETRLSEMDKVDKDTFYSVKKNFDKEREENLKNEYVKVSDADDTKKKLVNIILNGDTQEIRQILEEEPDLVEEPFKNYDSSNDSHNEKVLSWYYQSKGHETDEIEILVNKAKEDLTLDEKASKVVEKVKDNYKERVEQKEQSILKEKEEEKEALKEYKKDLTEKFKELGVKEKTLKKFTDFATKENKDGGLPVDEMYEEWMKDPDKAKDLIYFMLEKDDYIKKQTEEMRRDLSIDNLRRIKRVSDSQSKKSSKKEEIEEKDSKEWIDEITFEE